MDEDSAYMLQRKTVDSTDEKRLQYRASTMNILERLEVFADEGLQALASAVVDLRAEVTASP